LGLSLWGTIVQKRGSGMLVFLAAVTGHWLFWIGLLLMVEPYLEGVAPRIGDRLKTLLAKRPEGRKAIFRWAGVIALFIACFQVWGEEHQARLIAESRTAALQPQRDPDGIYQLGDLVGHVSEAREALSIGQIHFAQITAVGSFNPSAEFEYRRFRA
jgi:hypothetical protein